MSDLTLEAISKKLDDVLDKLDALTVGAPPSAPSEFIVPGPNGLALVDGVVLAIDEPIRADYKVSMESRVICAQGRIGREPSNAFDSGLPKRSPAGYPMVYGVGMYGPVAPGRVAYDGSTFVNDAEVATYKEAVAKRPPPGSGRDFSPYK